MGLEEAREKCVGGSSALPVPVLAYRYHMWLQAVATACDVWLNYWLSPKSDAFSDVRT